MNSAVVEIRLAEGTYSVPDEHGSFLIAKGCLITGGFEDSDDPGPSDPELYHTILTGDVDGDDSELTPSTFDENAWHVIEVSNLLEFMGDVELVGLIVEHVSLPISGGQGRSRGQCPPVAARGGPSDGESTTYAGVS